MESKFMRILTPALLSLSMLAALGLAGCGHNMEQRAATGAVAGAVVAGPPGALVGAGVGAVVNEVKKPNR